MVTHQYTVLTGGTVLVTGPAAGEGAPPSASAEVASAIAWAEDTVLAVGSDAAVKSLSRGDSRFGDLRGALVVPFSGALEPGAPADFTVLSAAAEGSPGGELAARLIAVVRGGRVVEGELPGP